MNLLLSTLAILIVSFLMAYLSTKKMQKLRSIKFNHTKLSNTKGKIEFIKGEKR